MRLSNAVGVPARLDVGSTGDAEMLGIVAAKVTYRLEDDWMVPVPPEEAWPIFDKPYVYDGVTLGPELDFRRRGVDLLVFGSAVAPRHEPVASMRVGIATGRVQHEVVVYGDRVWRHDFVGLVASEPVPFATMPLTNDRAFGGRTLADGLEFIHPVNPVGRGLYLTAQSAVGQPLPNLERPDALIRSWQDNPQPACLFRPAGALLPTAPIRDVSDLVGSAMASGFNSAVAELTVPLNGLGDTLTLTGYAATGDIVLPMPARYGPTAHVALGTTRSRFPTTISTIVVLAPERVMIVTYAGAFRYLMRPGEQRSAELRWPPQPVATSVVPDPSLPR